MAADLQGFTEQEVLNKVLNTASDSFKVDIVSGSEYAEDDLHSSGDTGTFILGVRNDVLAELGGDDGDYVPFQMNASGAAYVEAAIESGQVKSGAIASGAVASGAIASGAVASGAVASGAVASGAIASGALASGSVVDGAMVTLGAKADAKSTATDTTAITAMQVLKQISASVQETATDTGTIDADTNAIKTAVELLDNAVDGNYLNTNINLAGSDAPTGGGTESGVLRVTIANNSTGVLSVDDGGGALTVDGTVTANLGTTDNAVLDAIAASLALLDNSIASGSELQVDVVASLPAGSNTIGVVDLGSTDNAVLDAMVVDLAEIEVATEASQAALEKMLYGTALAVDYSGGDHSLGATYEAFYIGVGGDVSLDLATGGANIVFKNLASGQLLPVRATVVNQTGTTATDIVALKA